MCAQALIARGADVDAPHVCACGTDPAAPLLLMLHGMRARAMPRETDESGTITLAEMLVSCSADSLLEDAPSAVVAANLRKVSRVD